MVRILRKAAIGVYSIDTYRVGQKIKLLHFVHIFAKYYQFFTIFKNILCQKFATRRHTRHAYYSLHYLVKYKYLKTCNIYKWTEGLMVYF